MPNTADVVPLRIALNLSIDAATIVAAANIVAVTAVMATVQDLPTDRGCNADAIRTSVPSSVDTHNIANGIQSAQNTNGKTGE